MTGGIDIGGTKIRWVVMKGNRVIAAHEVKTPRTQSLFLALIRGIFIEFEKRGVRRVGIGAPGVVSGTVFISAPNIPFIHRLDFQKIAPRGMRICLDNDARCFARAEARSWTSARRIFCVTIGTGIGRAITEAGEPALIRRFDTLAPWERQYQRRRRGDLASLADFLGDKLSAMARDIHPDILVIGGGALERPGFFLSIRERLRAAGATYSVRRARLRKNAGAMGAAWLAAGV